MKGIVISATSDIATEMCLKWKGQGWDVLGTYLSTGENYHRLSKADIPLVHCDLSDNNSMNAALIDMKPFSWDFIVFATGTQYPVGPFEKIDIDAWIESIHVNFLSQAKLLHGLLPYRNRMPDEKSVLFFAGGGTNNAVDAYSAYTESKIALIKLCELLDSEIDDVKFSIIGPGWVKTKIHQTTLETDKALVGQNYEKTKEKLNSDECVPIDQVIDSFEWVMSQPKAVVGGRNFSTVFDQWGTDELAETLLKCPDMYKLRRYGNEVLQKA